MSQAYGREAFVFVKKETVPGTYVHPAAGDAIQTISCDLGFKHERKDIPLKSSSRSLVTRVTGRRSATWSIEKYLMPSGTAGTAPDDADLFEALFGTVVDGASDVVYSLAKEPGIGLSILCQDGHHQEAVCGAVPGKMSIKFGGGEEPKVSFSGEAYDHYLSGSDILASAASATDKIIVTDARQFCVGMKVRVGTEDNTTGFVIDAIDYVTNELDLSANVTNQAKDAAVIPFALTPTYTGDVMVVTAGTVTIGGTTIYVTGATFDVDQKPKLRNDEFGLALPRGLRYPDRREVRVSMDLYFESGAVKWYNDAKRFTAQDICLLIGDTAGKKVQIDANQVEFDIPSVKRPESDEATITISGICKGTATGEDECTVTFK